MSPAMAGLSKDASAVALKGYGGTSKDLRRSPPKSPGETYYCTS